MGQEGVTIEKLLADVTAKDLLIAQLSEGEEEYLSHTFNILRSGETVIISGIALAEGTWNGKFYPRNEIKKSEGSLLGKSLDVEHGRDPRWGNTVVGKVIDEKWSDTLQALIFKAKITNKQMAQEVANGYWKAVSVVVKRKLGLTEGKLSCHNISYLTVSLTKTPACAICQVTSVSVDKLHLYKEELEQTMNSDTMTNDNITEESTDTDTESLAVWDTKYINDLPNSAFIIVEPCADTKKTARHLPYKDKEGKVNLPHLRNAMARANQIKSVCGGSDEDLRKRAISKVRSIAKKHGIKVKGKEKSSLSEETECLAEKNAREAMSKIMAILTTEGSNDDKIVKVREIALESQLKEYGAADAFKLLVNEIGDMKKAFLEFKETKTKEEDTETEESEESAASTEGDTKEDEKEGEKEGLTEKEDEKEDSEEDKTEDTETEGSDKDKTEDSEEDKTEDTKGDEDETVTEPTLTDIIDSKDMKTEEGREEAKELAVELIFEYAKRQAGK